MVSTVQPSVTTAKISNVTEKYQAVLSKSQKGYLGTLASVLNQEGATWQSLSFGQIQHFLRKGNIEKIQTLALNGGYYEGLRGRKHNDGLVGSNTLKALEIYQDANSAELRQVLTVILSGRNPLAADPKPTTLLARLELVPSPASKHVPGQKDYERYAGELTEKKNFSFQRNDHVQALQKKLNKYYRDDEDSTIDGIYGKGTRAAMSRYGLKRELEDIIIDGRQMSAAGKTYEMKYDTGGAVGVVEWGVELASSGAIKALISMNTISGTITAQFYNHIGEVAEEEASPIKGKLSARVALRESEGLLKRYFSQNQTKE